MGIKFYCPSCDKRLNVKSFLAGKAGFCPQCQARIQIPTESQPKRDAALNAGRSASVRQPALSSPEAVADASPATVNANPVTNGQGKHHPVAAVVAASGSPYSATPTNRMSPADLREGGVRVEERKPVAGDAVAPAMPASAPAGAVADPIAEKPTAVWYVRPPTGGQYGPAPGDVMRKWMAEGRISADSLVWREGWPDWRKASNVFPALVPAAAAPAPARVEPMTVANTAPHRTVRLPRKRNSTAFAITAIVALVLMSVALLATLLYVLFSS